MHYTFIYSIDINGFERVLRAEFKRAVFRRAEFNHVFEGLSSNLNNPFLAFLNKSCISL